MYFPLKNFVVVHDPEGDIVFEREDLMKYSGPRGLIASGLVIRLLARAFDDLSPHEPPARSELKFVTAFPGSDVLDGFELVTKAVSGRRCIVDLAKAPKDAPASPVGGAMYFEVVYRGKAMAYTFSKEIFTVEWVQEVLQNQENSPTIEDHAKYLQYKHSVLGKILAMPNPFSRAEPCEVDPRLP